MKCKPQRTPSFAFPQSLSRSCKLVNLRLQACLQGLPSSFVTRLQACLKPCLQDLQLASSLFARPSACLKLVCMTFSLPKACLHDLQLALSLFARPSACLKLVCMTFSLPKACLQDVKLACTTFRLFARPQAFLARPSTWLYDLPLGCKTFGLVVRPGCKAPTQPFAPICS